MHNNELRITDRIKMFIYQDNQNHIYFLFCFLQYFNCFVQKLEAVNDSKEY